MSKAYTYTISANGADGTHSVSPHWILTFVRWENRHLNISEDGLNKEQRADFLKAKEPMIVESDCAAVSVSYSKESHTPSMQAMLYPGNANYLTAISPGDFVFVNMLNFAEDAAKVTEKIKNKKPINDPEDGFKGLFKVQSVRRLLAIDPATGIKKVMFQISGFAFTEFNNTLYFNPFLLSKNEANNQYLFVTRISEIWQQYVGDKGTIKVENILKLLINSTIGLGLNQKLNKIKENLEISYNVHFYIPSSVGELLGIPEAKSAKDIYNYLFGIQKYNASSDKIYRQYGETPSLADNLNPQLKSVEGRFYLTGTPCQGAALLKPEYWNQVTVWSILNQYTNSPINELFVTLRISPEGKVMPTVVFRQIPFSSEKYKGIGTKFLNLPRWKINPNMLLDINIGRDEAARINFVQVFGIVPTAHQTSNSGFISQQIGAGNFYFDQLDIRRSGLKPYIVTSNFDAVITKTGFNSPTWAKLLADSLIGGELKLNGSIECVGIVDPIAVGDNLELDGVVYHIESISHNCSLSSDGKKNFSTSIQISHGLDLRSEEGPKIFPQMDNSNIKKEQENDFNNFDANLPGFSHEQIETTKPADELGSFSSYANKPVVEVKKNKTTKNKGNKK